MKKILLLMALVSLTFMNAQVTIFEDSFDAYADFEIATIGNWTQIDNDGNGTYSIQDRTFLNQGYTGTAIIFNSSVVVTTATGVADLTGWDSRTGAKGLYFFAATNSPNGTAENDDYMITPQIDLSGATSSSLSMWAKTLVDTWGNEKFEVLLSATGNAQADFTQNLTGGVVTDTPTDFTEYTFDLSAYDGQQIYIAIHYVGTDTFCFAVDDFKVTAAAVTSVEDDILASEVSIYPTTVDSNFTINNKSAIALNTVKVYDINGRVLLQQNLNNLIGEATINIANLNAGMYFVELNSADAKLVRKIIKK